MVTWIYDLRPWYPQRAERGDQWRYSTWGCTISEAVIFPWEDTVEILAGKSVDLNENISTHQRIMTSWISRNRCVMHLRPWNARTRMESSNFPRSLVHTLATLLVMMTTMTIQSKRIRESRKSDVLQQTLSISNSPTTPTWIWKDKAEGPKSATILNTGVSSILGDGILNRMATSRLCRFICTRTPRNCHLLILFLMHWPDSRPWRNRSVVDGSVNHPCGLRIPTLMLLFQTLQSKCLKLVDLMIADHRERSVVLATGVIALVDNTIKTAWPRRTRPFIIPLLNLSSSSPPASQHSTNKAAARNLIDTVFSRPQNIQRRQTSLATTPYASNRRRLTQ